MISQLFMNRCCQVLFLYVICSLNTFSQAFKLPPVPAYDSVYIDQYENTVMSKNYFLKGKKVFMIGYNTGSMFYVPFFDIGGGEEDSCYAYFNGAEHDQYDFYYMNKSYIKNDRYAENSKLFRYKKFTWNNVPIESGNSYFIKEMHESTISHYNRYRIGKWVTYDAKGKSVEVVDYDSSTVNGKKIVFQGKMKIVDSLKTIAMNKLIQVYGKDFYSKYIRFNLARSGYYTYQPGPDQPGGASLLTPTTKDIEYVDLSYDIILGSERFNVIQLRLSRKGELLGHTTFSNYGRDFYLTLGLDSTNNGKLHSSVLEWEKIAKQKGLDIASAGFNVRMVFYPKSDYYGELRLLLEQITSSESGKYYFINKIKVFTINPWTGAITESETEEGLEGVMTEEELTGTESK